MLIGRVQDRRKNGPSGRINIRKSAKIYIIFLKILEFSLKNECKEMPFKSLPRGEEGVLWTN